MVNVWNADLALTLFVQALGAWLTLPMQAFSFLGQETFFMLVMPAIYWCLDAAVGVRVGAMLLLGGSLNGYLKVLLHSPRPFWLSAQVHAYSVETSFGMPSGHSQNAAGIWGLLAALLRKRWAWITLLIMVFLIGFSRIYLGMHLSEDVLAGWTIGGLLVYLFLRLDKPLSAWLSKQSFNTLVGLTLASAAAIIGLHYLSVYAIAGWQLPTAWQQNAALVTGVGAESPFAASGQVTSAGVWFGFMLGIAWLQRGRGYRADGTATQKIVRYILGGAGVLVFYVGLGQLLPDGETLWPLLLRFSRYSLVGAWVSVGAPLVFIRLKLASTARDIQVERELNPQAAGGD
jgi:membrane-associated phospholipid phosphatase